MGRPGKPACYGQMRETFSTSNLPAREFMAEFLGTFILITLGDGSVAQHKLSRGTAGEFLTVNMAWGLAVSMAIWASGGVTGGHVNPAVTLCMCMQGRTRWSRLPLYWLAQYLGAIVASACVYGVYIDALNNYDGGVRSTEGENATAGIWATYPAGDWMRTTTGFGDQILGTALLLICVLAITDKRNMQPPKGMIPFCVGLVVMVIGMSFGFNCGYAINPARDWGPRIFTCMAGWGTEPFSFRDYNWFWVPFVGPHVGAILGSWTYLLLVGNHFPRDGEGQDEVKEEEQGVKLRPVSVDNKEPYDGYRTENFSSDNRAYAELHVNSSRPYTGYQTRPALPSERLAVGAPQPDYRY